MKPAWRTVTVALSGMGALLVGLALTGLFPGASASYPAFAGGIGACVAFVAAKAAVEHAKAAT